MPAPLDYATNTDFEALGLPTKATVGLINTEVAKAITGASRLADSYLRSRYLMPLLTWDNALTRAICEIAVYDVMSRRGFNPDNAADANIRMRYEDAIKWLKCVADGGISPDITDSTPPPGVADTGNETIVTSNPKRGW